VSRRTPPAQRPVKEAVFREMFQTHFARVARYVEGQLGEAGPAEEIAAEVFHVAWQKLDPEKPYGLPWLIRTAMHKTRDYQRSQYRGTAATVALARLVQEPSSQMSVLDRLALVEALSGLSEKDRQIVMLTYWESLSAGEVAQVLRMREGAVWTRLHRARRQLRTALSGEERDER
jgi:RNA polymerase sigma-70 factor (ECF subfamily)